MLMFSQNCSLLWINLIEYCNKGNIDPREFRNKQTEIVNLYKRMNYQEQGEYHRLVAEYYSNTK
jgi:hypothetical protein